MDRNRERITLVADERGGAYVRILDRRTRAQAFLRLGDDDAAYLEFLRWTDGVIQTRRLGFGPDTVLKLPGPTLGRIPFVPQLASCSPVISGVPAAMGAAA